MKVTIAQKLGLGFAIVILLMITGAIIAYIETGDMVTSQSNAVDEAVPTARACDQLSSAIHASMAAFRGYLILGSDPSEAEYFKAEHDAAWASIDEALTKLNTFSTAWSESDAAKLVELTRELEQFRSAHLNARRLAHMDDRVDGRQAESRSRADDVFASEAVPHIAAIKERLTQLSTSADERVAKARAEMARAAGTLRATLLIASGLAIIVGTFVAVVLSRTIVVAIGHVVTRAREIASGDLTGAPLEVRGNDEIATLAESFNQMQVGLKDVTSQIRQVTGSVNSAAAEILAAAQQQAAGTKEQAATLQQITSTMQEICQSGEQVSQRAKEVVSGVETTISSNASGVEAVQTSTRNMDTIREQVEEVAENIVALSERTQTIGEIIAAVTDIAEQSNLLALNAAIEAVSAGEQGSRFGVVAAEMKNLADQAKECTVQVRNILSEIQKGINSSVMMTEEAVKRVETGKMQAGSTERTIREMTSTTQTSVQTFEQIIGASAQQQIGFDQVTRGVKDIHIAVEQTAAGVMQLERATASLNALGQQLRTAVDRYRI